MKAFITAVMSALSTKTPVDPSLANACIGYVGGSREIDVREIISEKGLSRIVFTKSWLHLDTSSEHNVALSTHLLKILLLAHTRSIDDDINIACALVAIEEAMNALQDKRASDKPVSPDQVKLHYPKEGD